MGWQCIGTQRTYLEMKGLLVDLDDTLFEELDYVRSGHIAVAQLISNRHNIPFNILLDYFKYEMAQYGRIGLFSRILNKFKIEEDISNLINVYRGHRPEINLYPGVLNKIVKMKQLGFKIIIVTDGIKEVQKKKCEALGLNKIVDSVYCADYKPKPEVDTFLAAATKINLPIEDCVVIGDDPFKDGLAAESLGIDFYRVLTGKYRHIGQSKNMNDSFAEIIL